MVDCKHLTITFTAVKLVYSLLSILVLMYMTVLAPPRSAVFLWNRFQLTHTHTESAHDGWVKEQRQWKGWGVEEVKNKEVERVWSKQITKQPHSSRTYLPLTSKGSAFQSRWMSNQVRVLTGNTIATGSDLKRDLNHLFPRLNKSHGNLKKIPTRCLSLVCLQINHMTWRNTKVLPGPSQGWRSPSPSSPQHWGPPWS